MPTTPPQLVALVDALPQLGTATLRMTFEVCVTRMKKEDVPEATDEALKSDLEAAGIDAAGQGPLLEASQFLLRQAAKTDEAKRIERLKPMGFSEEQIRILSEVLAAAKPKPKESAEEPAAQDDEPPTEEEQTISQEELDKMAAEMVGDEVEEEEEEEEEDDDAADEPEPEPDFEDSDPCEVLLKVNRKILEEFLKMTTKHIIGQDLSKREVDALEDRAREAGVSQRTLRQLLKLMKNLLTQGLVATEPGQIAAAKTLRMVKMGVSPGMKVLADVTAGVPPTAAVEEGIPPDAASAGGEGGEGEEPAVDTSDKGAIMMLAMDFMPPKKAKMFSDTVRHIQTATAPVEEDEYAEDAVHLRGFLLSEIGNDRDKTLRQWQRRYLVISPGTLEFYYSAEISSEKERICKMPLKFVYIQEPKEPRENAPFAFRIGVKDMSRVEGEGVNKYILDAETEENKKKWMDTLNAAKFQDAPMAGPMRFEIPHKMKKWTKFEDRWFVAAAGRLEMYPSQAAVETDDYISIIPLCDWGTDEESGERVLKPICEIMANPKTKRADAPNCFRINIGIGDKPIKVMGTPISKLVVDALELDVKEEWLAALNLCQQIELPDEVRTRVKEVTADQPVAAEPPSPAVDATLHKVIVPKAESKFDQYGRARGDPAFGKPLGWTPESSDEEDDEDEDDDDSDSDEEDSSEEEDAKPRGPPRKMLWTLFTDEVVKPDVVPSKFAKTTEHFYVLYVGWLIVYKQEVDTKDRASQEHLVSRIPLSVCSVAEFAPKKDTSTEHSFQIKIDNHKSLRGEQYTSIYIHPTDAPKREQWLDALALACDSDESDEEYEPDEKARPDDVVASAKEFDAKQVVTSDGDEDNEREVIVRTTICGTVVMDGNDKSIILQYFPNSSIAGVKTATLTVDSETAQCCQLAVEPSRSMSKKVKRTTLQFVMKDPQRLVDAVKANESVAPESDVCTDSIVVSFFETHPDYNELGFAQCRAERMLDKLTKLSISTKGPDGVTRTTKKSSWWTKQMVTVNEATLSWFDLDADNKPSSKSAGQVTLVDITAVNWPVHGEHHDERPRINCFSVEAGGKEHVFATPSKAWARHLVEALGDLRASSE